MTGQAPYLQSDDVTAFLRVLQEATRARPDGRQTVYIPPVNADKAEAEYHHIVFGQRGSGKSTLLRRLQQGQTGDRRLAAWIDQEIFADLAFPDVLVSSVEAVMRGTCETVQEYLAARRSALPWYRRCFAFASSDERDLLAGLRAVEANLRGLKFAPLESSIEWTRSQNATGSAGLAGTARCASMASTAQLAKLQEKVLHRARS